MLFPIGAYGQGLRPALALDFLGGAVDARLTVSGGANATRINSAGSIVAAVCPRFDYNPFTLAALGLLIEESRGNLLLNSLIDGTILGTQSVTVAAQAYTLSFYGTGTVTLSGTGTGTLVGSAVYPTRSVLTFTPTAGSLTLTVTGSVQFAQLEAGSFATSFTPTGASAVTRTADSVSMTGTNFSQWFNASAGTFVVEADTIFTVSAATIAAVAELGDGTYSNREMLYFDTANALRSTIAVSGTGVILSSGATASANVVAKFAHAFAGADQALSANASTVASSALPASLPAVNRLQIGSQAAGGGYLNGHVRRLRYFPSRLPNASLQSLTA